jgi:hypothetical protein
MDENSRSSQKNGIGMGIRIQYADTSGSQEQEKRGYESGDLGQSRTNL